MKHYHVIKHEGSWEVVRRANKVNGNTVCTHSTREDARQCAAKREANPKASCQTDYATSNTPIGYVCAACGASGCKLWRQYQTFSPRLLCAPCAAKDQARDGQNLDISDIDADGKRTMTEYEWARDQRTDQLGWYVPAVPLAEGGGYWGYSSVPDAGVAWWRRLPTLPTR